MPRAEARGIRSSQGTIPDLPLASRSTSGGTAAKVTRTARGSLRLPRRGEPRAESQKAGALTVMEEAEA